MKPSEAIQSGRLRTRTPLPVKPVLRLDDAEQRVRDRMRKEARRQATAEAKSVREVTGHRAAMSVQLDVPTVRRLYLDEGQSLQEIGRALGCTGKTVGSFMEKHGIERRERGQGAAPGVTVAMRRDGRRAEQDLIRRGVMLPLGEGPA